MMSATSWALASSGPASSVTDWLPPSNSPSGRPWLADCKAPRTSSTVMALLAMRAASSCTSTARPGPPMVVTVRAPGTRISSASMLWATRSRAKGPLSGSSLNRVRVTTGTSSMPLGRMMGSCAPRPRGSQSALLRRVSCRRTSASVRGTPTANCTVSTAMPGRETLITCSTPSICASTCSAGVAIICSTSRTAAPGKGTMTLAMVTSICGSSSRGVTSTANRPSSRASRASNGVIWALWNAAAMRPERPMVAGVGFISAPLCGFLRLQGHLVTGAQTA